MLARRAVQLALLAALVPPIGCVERKLTIRSDPSGATVTLDGRRMGKTPVTVRFHDYGGREAILAKPLYARKLEILDVSPPFYQWFGIDFFSELIWPWTIVDHQTFTLKLKPIAELKGQESLDPAVIEARAKEMETRADRYQADYKAKHK